MRVLFGKSPNLKLILCEGYTSAPVRRIAGSRRVASASKRTPVAPKSSSLPNFFNPGATVELEITTENLMAALVLSDDADLESNTRLSTPSVCETQTEICKFP